MLSAKTAKNKTDTYVSAIPKFEIIFTCLMDSVDHPTCEIKSVKVSPPSDGVADEIEDVEVEGNTISPDDFEIMDGEDETKDENAENAEGDQETEEDAEDGEDEDKPVRHKRS